MQKISTLVLLVILAAITWYWMDGGDQGPSEEERALQRNTQLIKECIQRQDTLNAAARNAGDDSVVVDSREHCAKKYNLYDAGGQWLQLETNENDYWSPR